MKMKLVLQIREYTYYPARISLLMMSEKEVKSIFKGSKEVLDDEYTESTRSSFLIEDRHDISRALECIMDKDIFKPAWTMGDLKKLFDDTLLGDEFFQKFMVNVNYYLELKENDQAFDTWNQYSDNELVLCGDPKLIYWIYDNDRFQRLLVKFYTKKGFKFDPKFFPAISQDEMKAGLAKEEEKDREKAIKAKEKELEKLKAKMAALEIELEKLRV